VRVINRYPIARHSSTDLSLAEGAEILTAKLMPPFYTGGLGDLHLFVMEDLDAQKVIRRVMVRSTASPIPDEAVYVTTLQQEDPGMVEMHVFDEGRR
jgi:hypothetical protein